jgi:uncharacterized repeat protein (TIGR02543 family)
MGIAALVLCSVLVFPGCENLAGEDGAGTFAVSFDTQGGEPASIDDIQVKAGGTVTLPEDPVKTGHVFGGWYTRKNGGGKPFTGDTPVSGSITLYAKWVGETFTVTFDARGGSPSGTSKTAVYGETTGLPAEPVRPNYDFDGWYTGPDGGGTEFTNTTPVTADITVYARWIIEPGFTVYQLVFEAEGGEFSPGQARMTVEVIQGQPPVLPPAPVRKNHTFRGWYTERDGGGTEFTVAAAVSANTSVYAFWEIFTVTFDANGGFFTTLEGAPGILTRVPDDGGTVALPPNPGKTGFDFGGWKTGAGADFTAATVITASITVHAAWTAQPGVTVYTVVFDADGGSFDGSSTQTREAVNGAAIAFPPPPARTGYVFSGWYGGQNGAGGEFTETVTISADIRVYAWWRAFCTLTFDPAGGVLNGEASLSLERGTGAGTAFPPDPSRSGWNFTGWNTAANGSGGAFTADTVVNDNITVYAQWEENFIVEQSFGADALFEHLVNVTADSFDLGSFGAYTNVLRAENAPGNALEIAVTPDFTGILELHLGARVRRSTAGRFLWQTHTPETDSWPVFGANGNYPGSDPYGSRSAHTWYSFDITAEREVVSGEAFILQLSDGGEDNNFTFYLTDFSLSARKKNVAAGTEILLEDFEGTPVYSPKPNDTKVTVSLEEFNGSTILAVQAKDWDQGAAVKVTIPQGKTLGDYKKLLVDANCVGGTAIGGPSSSAEFKDLKVWITDDPAFAVGSNNQHMTVRLDSGVKTELKTYDAAGNKTEIGGLSASIKALGGEIYLIFGVRQNNNFILGVDNVKLVVDTGTTYEPYPLYEGQGE